MKEDEKFFIGADVCKSGWFAILIYGNNDWRANVFPNITCLWNEWGEASLILLDIPIGLQEKGSKERNCDKEARKLLGPRKASSVFRAPCRQAIYAENFDKANDINRKFTGKGLSIQTWNIIPKIREVDVFLCSNETARTKIREIHPEICFLALAGKPMKHSKKKREGFLERSLLLQSIYQPTNDIIEHALSTYRRKEVAKDDILDALSAAITARIGFKNLSFIPEIAEFDSCNLSMEMVYYRYI